MIYQSLWRSLRHWANRWSSS